GLIVADNGSSWYITGAPDPRWNDAGLEQIKRVPGSAFEAVPSGAIRPRGCPSQVQSAIAGAIADDDSRARTWAREWPLRGVPTPPTARFASLRRVSLGLVRRLGRRRLGRLSRRRGAEGLGGLLLRGLRGQGRRLGDRRLFGLAADRILELAHAAAERAPDLGQAPGAEHQQQDYDQESDVEWVI